MESTGIPDDAQVWDALDTFVNDSWHSFKNLLDVLFEEHYQDFDQGTQALLFGLLGRFMQVYYTRRSEANDPPESFRDAIGSAMTDNRMKALMESAASSGVDGFVANFRGE